MKSWLQAVLVEFGVGSPRAGLMEDISTMDDYELTIVTAYVKLFRKARGKEMVRSGD